MSHEPETLGDQSPAIHLRNLSKHYGTHVALADIDLTLATRQIVGVVGADGAGKTTLLRSLAGLLEIAADEASVLGHDLRGDVTALKAEVGYVPQAFSLHRDLSVAENLRFTGRLHRLPAAEHARRAQELLERTGLAPFAARPAGALSGGMKQKLAVANALLAEPRLLLLDEPTAGVDVVARQEVWTMLEHAARVALVVISTGYLDEAAACHRLIYLEGGRVRAAGTPAELSASVGLDVYRVWGDDPRRIARVARELPGVDGARATGRVARVEARRGDDAAREHILRALRALPAGGVHFVERTAPDMEAVLRALASASTRSTEG
jgi:ABC-2 type transport system ATP-binding protein